MLNLIVTKEYVDTYPDMIQVLEEGRENGLVMRIQGVSLTGPCSDCSQWFGVVHDGSGKKVPLITLHKWCVCTDMPVPFVEFMTEGKMKGEGVERIEWLASQTDGAIRNILGARRYELVQEGKIRMQDLFNKFGEMILLKDLNIKME